MLYGMYVYIPLPLRTVHFDEYMLLGFSILGMGLFLRRGSLEVC